jgi:hypothetical protein
MIEKPTTYKVLYARVPENEFKQIKIACAKIGISMQEMIRNGTRYYIKEIIKRSRRSEGAPIRRLEIRHSHSYSSC